MIRSMIREKLTQGLHPKILEVTDESDKHIGHAAYRPEGQTHFRVRIVSQAFKDKTPVERHRMVNALLVDAFAAGLHALAIEAQAPEE